MTTLYVAGPMTGLPDLNFPAFDFAEKELRDWGYEVLNPTRHEGKAEDWVGYMRLGLRDVLEADGLCVLTGWEQSRGACLEVHVAGGLNLPTLGLHQWWHEAATRG